MPEEWPHLFELLPMPALFFFFGVLAMVAVALRMFRNADGGDGE